MRTDFSHDDVEALRGLHSQMQEDDKMRPPSGDEQVRERRSFDALLRVIIGLAQIHLDREAAERNAATEALR